MTRALWAGSVRLAALIFILLSGSLAMAQTAGQPAPSPSGAAESEQVRQFLHLLADPSVQDWLRKAQNAQPAETPPQQHGKQPPATNTQPTGASQTTPPGTAQGANHMLADRIANSRAHVQQVITSLPSLPQQIATAGEVLAIALKGDENTHGGELLLIAFVLGAAGAFSVRRWGAQATREWQQAHPDPTGKLKRLGLRLMIATLPALAFVTGVLAALFIFIWPPALKTIAIDLGLALAIILLVERVLRVLMVNTAPPAAAVSSPSASQPQESAPPASETVPSAPFAETLGETLAETPQDAAVATDAASPLEASLATPQTAAEGEASTTEDVEHSTFWYRRILWFTGYFVLAAASINILRVLGLPETAVEACAQLLSIGQLLLAIEVIWNRPASRSKEPKEQRTQLGQKITNVFLTLLVVLLWWVWSIALYGLFWLCTFLIVLPPLIRAINSRVKGLLRPTAGPGKSHASVGEVCLSHGASLLLIVGAVYWMSYIWNIDLGAIADQTTPLKRLVRGLLNAVITLFVANFLWQLLRALIDKRIANAGPGQGHGDDGHDSGHVGLAHGDDAVRQARIRTLLPIFRNALPLLIGSVAIMMALSGLGIEIGPLIAGAGVIGVAVGFGSQTLVKDVISGVFYLLDDAFRVGEYIQSGHYKGTVESFSLRSVKLRHQRGPIFTVPFGQLGAVQNMSRDWIMDKFVINITYDSDLEAARKIIKKIGQELAEDPVHKPNILEPLKMQGVQEFGEYGIQIRCKIMTRPGTQFTIHRLALRRIKESFDAAGIHFALPQVRVAGNGEGDPALAAASRIRDSLAKEQNEGA